MDLFKSLTPSIKLVACPSQFVLQTGLKPQILPLVGEKCAGTFRVILFDADTVYIVGNLSGH